ncbi:unnamed protein product [Mytilus coruscus]|uniref:Uncharacterized protein n=1 Tax=Mytilus coruscus TaxID=42192 RepID=A0A6J8AY16_MYTCO|nr:unnamed protein product [Mytilus coruscus]
MIIYAKEQFYLNANGLLDEKSNKNPKAFWSLVKKVMGNCRSTSIPPLLNPNTNEISVVKKKKQICLTHIFCNISKSSDDGVTPPDLPLRTQHSLDIDEITEDEIKDILKSLEIGKASGEDCISHQMLKYTANSYTIADAIWKTKSDEEKRKLFTNFLQDSKKRKHDNIITSSDGLYSVVNKAKSIAKKPMQRKRPRTERAEKRH